MSATDTAHRAADGRVIRPNAVVQYGPRSWQLGFVREIDGKIVVIERPTRTIRRPVGDILRVYYHASGQARDIA